MATHEELAANPLVNLHPKSFGCPEISHPQVFLCGEQFRHYEEIKEKKEARGLKDGDHFVGQTYKMTGHYVSAMCLFCDCSCVARELQENSYAAHNAVLSK